MLNSGPPSLGPWSSLELVQSADALRNIFLSVPVGVVPVLRWAEKKGRRAVQPCRGSNELPGQLIISLYKAKMCCSILRSTLYESPGPISAQGTDRSLQLCKRPLQRILSRIYLILDHGIQITVGSKMDSCCRCHKMPTLRMTASPPLISNLWRFCKTSQNSCVFQETSQTHCVCD
jgi:hypothetical protein